MFSSLSFDKNLAKRRETKDKFDFQDYAVIEKISHLVHAVGRVSGGNGSAILISLPDPVAFSDYQQRHDATRRLSTRSRRLPARQPRGAAPGGEDVPYSEPLSNSVHRASPHARFARHLSAHAGGGAGGAMAGRGAPSSASMHDVHAADEKMASHFAVLLTTSQVFADREAASGQTVTFLEQTVAGTAALLGRQPRPITVAVRSDCGFVSSLSESDHEVRRDGGDDKRSQRHARGLDRGDTTRERGRMDEVADTVSIGYTLTYCEVIPTASRVVEMDRGAESMSSGAGSYVAGASFMGSSFATAEQQSQQGQRATVWGNTRVPRDRRLDSTVRRGLYPAGTVAGMQSSCESLAQYCKPSQEDLFLIKPLPMPLLAASIAPVRPGDVHLWVTHFSDGLRHYTLRRVAEVSEDCCLYEDDKDDAAEWSSGGPVFDANGDFVGVQHQADGEALCIFTLSMVRHLFATNKLALCRSPIVAGPPPGYHNNILDPNTEERDLNLDGTTTLTRDRDSMGGTTTGTQERPSVLGSSSSGSLRTGPTQVADFQQLLDARVRRERQMPVTQRVPTTEEVFAAFHTDFHSLSFMLHAFSYCPRLTERILAEVSRHEFRGKWSSLAASGAVGLTLEIIDGNADDEALVTTALSTLAQLSIFDGNLTVFVHVDGVPTVLEIMKEYIHAPHVLQWGAYCLVQATAPTAPFVAETLEAFTRSAGLELAVECLRLHGAEHRHLTHWVSILIANTLRREPKYTTVVIHEDLPSLLMQYISDYSDDFSVLEGLLRLLHTIVTPLAGVESAGVIHSHRRPNQTPTSTATAPASASADGATDLSPLTTPHTLGEVVPHKVFSTFLGSPPFSDLHRLSSSSDVSGGRGAFTPAVTAERNAFFVRRAFARHERLLWNVLAHACDAASRVRYSSGSVDLMQLALETLLVMVQWDFLPVRRVRNQLMSAWERTEVHYPTQAALLACFRRCHTAIDDAIAEKEATGKDHEVVATPMAAQTTAADVPQA